MEKRKISFILICFILTTTTWCKGSEEKSDGGITTKSKRSNYLDNSKEDLVYATNKTSVPSVNYIVDAVRFLKQAFTIHPDVRSRARLYLTLFQGRYAQNDWSILVGYKSVVLNANWYIEVSTFTTYQEKSSGDIKRNLTYYMIFSGQGHCSNPLHGI